MSTPAVQRLQTGARWPRRERSRPTLGEKQPFPLAPHSDSFKGGMTYQMWAGGFQDCFVCCRLSGAGSVELGGAAWWSQGSCWQKDHRQQAALAPGSWLTLGSWTESAALRAVAPGFPDHDPPVPVSSRWAVAGQRLPCPGKARQRAPSTLLSASLCGLTGTGSVRRPQSCALCCQDARSGKLQRKEAAGEKKSRCPPEGHKTFII
ncbi:uncharacterized protein LOC109490109 [Ailuropoda melanoleuca]|uniref:uncharacterized protein LOC109490109 n=1 Tax=Ailuropoda melanoleuca TaxID=9646 RepID=UPI001494309C|nr:uncharacterized protein LOC109490109 [Ailuropoda melanoleuca]